MTPPTIYATVAAMIAPALFLTAILEVQFFFELERLRGEPVIDTSARPDHRLPTDPASRHSEPGRDRGDTLDRSKQGT
jgi:hypothetical protein